LQAQYEKMIASYYRSRI